MSTREEVLRRDAEDLRRLGYAQQLFREMGGFSNFAVSFSIISVLTGAILLFGYGLKLAGPIVNTIGGPLVSLFTPAIAASMAELADAGQTCASEEHMVDRQHQEWRQKPEQRNQPPRAAEQKPRFSRRQRQIQRCT